MSSTKISITCLMICMHLAFARFHLTFLPHRRHLNNKECIEAVHTHISKGATINRAYPGDITAKGLLMHRGCSHAANVYLHLPSKISTNTSGAEDWALTIRCGNITDGAGTKVLFSWLLVNMSASMCRRQVLAEWLTASSRLHANKIGEM